MTRPIIASSIHSPLYHFVPLTNTSPFPSVFLSLLPLYLPPYIYFRYLFRAGSRYFKLWWCSYSVRLVEVYHGEATSTMHFYHTLPSGCKVCKIHFWFPSLHPLPSRFPCILLIYICFYHSSHLPWSPLTVAWRVTIQVAWSITTCPFGVGRQRRRHLPPQPLPPSILLRYLPLLSHHVISSSFIGLWKVTVHWVMAWMWHG